MLLHVASQTGLESLYPLLKIAGHLVCPHCPLDWQVVEVCHHVWFVLDVAYHHFWFVLKVVCCHLPSVKMFDYLVKKECCLNSLTIVNHHFVLSLEMNMPPSLPSIIEKKQS